MEVEICPNCHEPAPHGLYSTGPLYDANGEEHLGVTHCGCYHDLRKGEADDTADADMENGLRGTCPTQWVVGFLFDRDYYHSYTKIVLIQKHRPQKHYNRFNGPGGAVEIGETPQDTMRREFREECGVDIPEWRMVCQYEVTEGTVFFLTAHSHAANSVKKMTDEPVFLYRLADLHTLDLVWPTAWIIPLCFDRNTELPITISERW